VNPSPDHRTQNWHVRKPAARSRRGIVASQHQLAAEVGAGMLAAGGNAVDAAVAAGFALAAIDPHPGAPNSLAPAKRPLTNMCPVIAHRDGKPWFAIGASGGRKIFPAVLQIASFLIDHGMSLEDAFHQPRLDASGGEHVGVDPRLPREVKSALSGKFTVHPAELAVYPANFACPSAVLGDLTTGERFGISDVMSPWSGAAAEKEP